MSTPMDILIVDDEEVFSQALSAWLAKDGYRAETAASGPEALAKLTDRLYDLYLVDIKMPGMDGLEVLARLREIDPEAMVIMITAHGSIQTAVEAMKRGASDYLCKPFDPDQLSLLMERVAASRALQRENALLRQQLADSRRPELEGLVALSPAMVEVCAQIEQVADADAPVLITGETGVGKDLVARAIHAASGRCNGPFVAINCGAQTESLLESELFGHEEGAFTGAVRARRGRLEMADQGTLFLDEIGEVSPKMQVALLRALEDKSFVRVGGTQTVRSDFRLISATHRDLAQMVRQERFRQDFFYRINVLHIHIPPLRRRTEDIAPLADLFLERYGAETGKRIEGFTARAMEILCAYDWPGNVRELRNVIERAVVLAKGRMIGARELSFLQPQQAVCADEALSLKEMELRHIRAALEACKGNVTQAARRLGIDRVTLTRKMKRHGIGRPQA